MWQDSSGDGHDERALRDMVFMLAKTDWDAPREERAYFDKERREGMLSDTELMMKEEWEDDGDDCRGEGASFILATQDILGVEGGCCSGLRSDFKVDRFGRAEMEMSMMGIQGD